MAATTGVFHGAEIRFVFHILASLQYGPGQCEVKLSSQMVCFWANFAATGDPNQVNDRQGTGSLHNDTHRTGAAQGDDCNAPSVIGRHGKGVDWRPFQPEAPPNQTNRI